VEKKCKVDVGCIIAVSFPVLFFGGIWGYTVFVLPAKEFRNEPLTNTERKTSSREI
jgi:hypothetical protein